MPPFLNVPANFLALPIVGSDTILVFRKDNYANPIVLRYSDLLASIIAAVPSGSSYITSVSDTSDIDLAVAAGVLTALLTATGVTAGTYGDSTHVPQIIVDAKGRITGVTSVAISSGGTGTVTNVSATAGTGISVNVTNPTSTPNITITNTAPDQVVSLTASTGISISGTYPNFTITNSLPDQTVVLNAGTGIGISGTYPNFTITNSSPSSGGTVTSVAALTIGTSGTDLSSTVANSTTTPVITLNVPTASATNRGALSSADWTTFNDKVPSSRTITGTKSITGGGDLSTNRTLELVNDATSPGNSKLYGTNSSGTKGWYSINQVAIATTMYQEDVYIAGTLCTSIEYVSSVNKVYVSNSTSGTVSIFDASNGDLLSSVVVTAPFKIKYIASINEVWVTSSSATTITRISPSGNTSLGTITGLTANGCDILEYSSTKVFVTVNAASGSIMVINPSTLSLTATITTSVPSFCYGMALNTNVSSSQYDKIIVTANAGIAIFNPATNAITTSVANPSSVFSNGRSIVYSPTQDKYYAASITNNRLVVLSIASSTTFTATFIQNQLYLSDLVIDETNDLLFAAPLEGGTVYNTLVKQYRLSTMSPIIAFRTSATGGTNTVSGYVVRDSANNRLFVVGRNNATNSGVCSIKYLP